MPQNFTSDGNETDTAALAPEYQQEDDTSFAENNEADASVSPPTSAEDTEEDAEALREKLKLKARNERQLGSTAAKVTRTLLDKALKGDVDSRNALEDPELNSYVQKKFPNEHKTIFGEPQVDPAQRAYDMVMEKQREDELRKTITARGIKGESDFNKIFETAKALKDFSMENAVNAAITAVKGNLPSSQPRMGGGVSPSLADAGVNMSNDAVDLAKNMGLSLDDIKKYGPK